MSKTIGWLRSRRKLLISFLLVVLPPAVTLVGLGIRLLEQDRALEHQRRIESLDRDADKGVRLLEQDITLRERRLAGPSWIASELPEDTVYVVLNTDRIEAVPAGRLPYFPAAPKLSEFPDKPFADLEAQEIRSGDLAKALKTADSLSASPDPLVRGGALLRKARILRKLNRPADAIECYDRISRIPFAAIEGTPADLVARKAKCATFAEFGRQKEQHQEAEALAADLRAGKWQLDQPTYEQVAGQIGAWLGTQLSPTAEQEGLAAGVARLYEHWKSSLQEQKSFSGREVVFSRSAPVTILWAFQPGRMTAFVAGPDYLRNHWLTSLEKSVSPAKAWLTTAGGNAIAGNPLPADIPRTSRPAENTGLPWTVVVAGDPGFAEFASRRLILLAGLAAVLVLVAAGSYFIWRAFNREMAVARLQSDFVSAVSHEFRTPLTTLRQFNDLLANDENLPPDKRRNFHAAQTRATERLHRLVESLLDFGRMEAGRRPYEFRIIDAGDLVRNVTEEFRSEPGASTFSVACASDTGVFPVRADSEALTLALRNLLDNAAKYSGAGTKIEVTVTRSNSAVSIAVRDEGIGIPAVEQKRIFRKFVRGAAAGKQGIPGTGIGLAMVRHIVGAHRGIVRVASAPGKGSTFEIVLPLSAE